MTVVGKDAIKTSSIDRIIGGEVAPDTDEIMMVRKAPAVGGAVVPVAPFVKPAVPAPVGVKVPAAPAVKPQP